MKFWLAMGWLLCTLTLCSAAEDVPQFPPQLESYGDTPLPLMAKLRHRVAAEPLNLAATIIFGLAIIHTFLASKIMHVAHRWRDEHRAKVQQRDEIATKPYKDAVDEVSFKAEAAHFFGEVEAIFGIWVVPLLFAFLILKDWNTAQHYIGHKVRYTEPLFVVVIMTIAATRPILMAAQQAMQLVARIGGGTPAASWLAILTIGPLLGSFITEPGAMTISALLLARSFYEFQPPRMFAYATLGLLFVNISIGGTLTHFAAPPVLMVAGTWGWGTTHMLGVFGWKAATAVVASNLLYYAWFRKQFAALKPDEPPVTAEERWEERTDPVPAWITMIHSLFLGWTVFTAHHPALFVGGFLFFLAFASA
ncbi:MAG: putative Na+/H+ antiporter, partial [Verrucomicrobia subdivision 3 bacterium]|nr:putative Na+/H+ antiporter [Limisphaerales bacterium]